MKQERTISTYKNYFTDFISSLKKEEAHKVYYTPDMLKIQERAGNKFVKYLRGELYKVRVEYGDNIFQVFFIFDDGSVVILFNGFQKKTQRTPPSGMEKALKIKGEYYGSKKWKPDQHRRCHGYGIRQAENT